MSLWSATYWKWFDFQGIALADASGLATPAPISIAKTSAFRRSLRPGIFIVFAFQADKGFSACG